MTMHLLLILGGSLLVSLAGLLALRMSQSRQAVLSSSWVAGLFLILLVMPVGLLLPGLTWTVESSSSGADAVSASTFSLATMILLLWAASVLILFVRFGRDHLSLKKWLSQLETVDDSALLSSLERVKEEAGIDSEVRVKMSGDLDSPVVAGLWSPHIVLPRNYQNWSVETLEMVLWHELGHVKRKDLWVAHLSRLICAVYCFNPFVFRLRQAFLSQCEYGCDAWVIRQGVSRKGYLNALCDVAEAVCDSVRQQGRLAFPADKMLAMGMAGEAPLADRVKKVMKSKGRSKPVYLVLFLLCNFVAGFSLSSMRVITADDLIVKSDSVSAEEVALRLTANPFPED